jgi:hypothetical protein
MNVFAIGEAACATSAFRVRGQLHVVVIVKATFAFAQDRPMTRVAADRITMVDEHAEGSPSRSLFAATDCAPYRPRADVVLRGHARAPAGQPVPVIPVRLAMARGDTMLIDKRLVVRGERSAEGPAAFTTAPLVYELSPAGPNGENPIGVAPGSGAWPRILDPQRLGRPAGFGPLDPRWPERRGRLRVAPASLDAPIPDLPEGFDWAYFNAAPEDQRVDFLRGDEWIGLEGMHAELPRVQSCLPGVRGLARLYGPLPGLAYGKPVALHADTLSIDADRMRCSVVFRGHFPMASDVALPGYYVIAGVEAWGQPLEFPPAYKPPLPAAPNVTSLDATITLAPSSVPRPVLPFVPASRAPEARRIDEPAAAQQEVRPALSAAMRLAGLPFVPAPASAPRSDPPEPRWLPPATPFDRLAPPPAPPLLEPLAEASSLASLPEPIRASSDVEDRPPSAGEAPRTLGEHFLAAMARTEKASGRAPTRLLGSGR